MEHTKGFMTGALVERQPHYILRVEFAVDGLRCNNEVLDQMDFTAADMIKVGYLHGKLLVNTEGAKGDPLKAAMELQFKKKFNSFVFVHDELLPLDV